MLCAIAFVCLSEPVVLGIDHVPIAVRDLGAAVETYGRLGFAIKPGREHENGIENAHVKFPDGTELELITAAEGVDALTREYRRFLDDGEGPAFVSFYAPDLERLSGRLGELGLEHDTRASMVTIPEGNPLRYIFFGTRNKSSTDRPEHFAHANGAVTLQRVWIAADDISKETRLLRGLGSQYSSGHVELPFLVENSFETFAEGQVAFFRGAFQTVKGRKIVGVTVTVGDLEKTKEWFSPITAPVAHMYQNSVVVRPEQAHGVWIEFREPASTLANRPTLAKPQS